MTDILAIGNFIDAIAFSVCGHSFSYDWNQVIIFIHAQQIQPRGRSVAGVDFHCLQAEDLLYEGAIFLKVYHSVELQEITGLMENAVFVDNLLRHDGELHIPQIE
jgi:hypothetical protein